MGFREKLNETPALAIGGASIMIVVGIGSCFFFTSRGRPQSVQIQTGPSVYYCDEQGKDPFGDIEGKPTPFEHNGAPAYRAFIYSCGEQGRLWVQCLEKKDADGNVFVKKPGDAQWIPDSDPRAAVIRKPICPDGRIPIQTQPIFN